MRFLANENVPLASIKKLRNKGYEVVAIAEVSPGLTDKQVLSHARLENLVILTFDRDYGKLIFFAELEVPAGVVYFRFDPASPAEPANRLLNLLRETGDAFLEKKFTVIDREQVRQRSLPSLRE